MKIYKDVFSKITSVENLFDSWQEFRKGKTKRSDVMAFEFSLERNIFDLRDELKSKRYKHAPYSSFFIQDPKQRNIHKARVRDRLVHHAIFAVLNPILKRLLSLILFPVKRAKARTRVWRRLRIYCVKPAKIILSPALCSNAILDNFFVRLTMKF